MKMVVKRVAASLLAFLLIATMLPADVVSAAAKKPTLSAATKTVTVGNTTKLTVKNKVAGSTYKWISKNAKIAKVSQKGTVRGVKAGKTSIVCKVKAGEKNYRLVCKVTVKSVSQTSQTVTTQKELNSALKNTKLKKLTIKTTKAIAFEIPEGDYSNIALVVNAPNADISNSGVFKSIDIKAIKGDTWYEKAKGNSFSILAEVARIVVDAGAKIVDLAVNQGGGSVKIEAQGSIESVAINTDAKVDLKVDGTVGKVDVNAPAALEVTGDTKEPISVTVSEAAKGAELTASTAVEVKTEVSVSVKLEKGAEGSKVAGTKANAEISLKNDTTEKIVIETPSGNKEVGAGQSTTITHTVTEATATDPGSSSWTGTEKHVYLKGVSGAEKEVTVEVGAKVKLEPIFDPVNATNKQVYWSISDSSYAYLNYQGVVTGRKAGDTTVTVSTDEMGYKYTWTIHVIDPALTGIQLLDTYNDLYSGESVIFKAMAVPAAASLEEMTWESSDPAVATIDAHTGKVTAVASGSTIITAKKGEISSEPYTLTVVEDDPNRKTITFKQDDNDFAVLKVEAGKTIAYVMDEMLHEPVKEGSVFKGWSATENGEVLPENTVINEDQTLYAVFEAEIYKITFYDGFTEFEKTESVAYGSTFTVPDITNQREGYEFLGWATSFSASVPEIKAGEEITCTDWEYYYAIWKVQMISITQTGENVKYYTGALKDLNNNNLTYNEDGTVPVKTGYISYSAKNEMVLRFRPANGYYITEITLDEVSHTAATAKDDNDWLSKAVAQGYVVVMRDGDHTIDIKVEPVTVTIDKVNENVIYEKQIIGENTLNNYKVTGSAISISDVVSVKVNELPGCTTEVIYSYGDNQTNGKDFQAIGVDDKVLTPLENGKHWQVRITVHVNGQFAQCDFIHVYVNPETEQNS
ncbi:MAG: Ig-like domain-containing protein [Lachnospiraceae bacterium]|nr:Ig-like domain-containing protein [Lachnospiraceae bacterium]